MGDRVLMQCLRGQ